ncbi:ATP-dependent DNA ligase [Candidatus Syntrophocurvum alkaliphilum]|uniref:ATP-dependent DNA ligase n=1 Tax=Candidatus Syntrophocurvum alkaliphilum TaxID=2293317 RepID=A0A6I6D6K7_9FIRM|nr:non-homologous end-joining DNA ligase [Candidatus Syntrophocurvum alkaliphilum]QGT98886.1 ATP-dependent DNA ligase [Candidatus Syntrophocurvum alkaliphilum]
MSKKESIEIQGNELTLSNLDKFLWPDQGFTKGELIKYYSVIAPYLINHLKNRPLVVTRYPDGITDKFFYQKNAPTHTPEWIKTHSIYSSDSKRYINFILVEKLSDLVWLANQACIEMHPWLSSVESLDFPDFAVFDIDPSEGSTYENVIQITLVLKKLLDSLNLRSYVKTSGATGLHVYLPIMSKYTYEDIRTFTHAIAKIVSEVLPDISTIERKVNQRGTKVYIDYLQNVKGKTLSSVYSVRPRDLAPVSTPLNWEEVTQVTPTDFNIKTVFKRIEQYGDLFAEVLSDKQNLDSAARELGVKLNKSLH